ncbi:MAG: AAA family ATPase [Phormidesmis sp.]
MGVDLMPFADNWAYLKTELAWLDRLLLLAVARQRKEIKTVKKYASVPADNVSSYWWKGVISVPNPAYDDCRVPTKAQRKPTGYQQQLESRIQVSAKDEIVLALPSIRHYLNLTLFEKNLLLMTLAPEINRRYGRLYHYLQTGEDCSKASDLPTVDLALRLLCRNDLERRRSRAKLTGPDSLIERKVLRYVSPRPTTRLSSYLQLSEDWVDYLLAEKPDQRVLFKRLATPTEPVLALPAPTSVTRAIQIIQPNVAWDKLILPAAILTQMQTLSQQVSASFITRTKTGKTALLVGAPGTGKTMAAKAIAASLRHPLCQVDLKQIEAADHADVLAALDPIRYPVLLIQSASVWFGRNSILPKAQLAKWLQQRQSAPGLLIFSSRHLHTIKASWRQQIDATITLPLPHRAERAMLWRQAFSGIACSDKIDWATLAQSYKLPGGEIQRIAQDAIAIAQSKNAKTITLSDIRQAIAQRGK